jgi:hypothetical protein
MNRFNVRTATRVPSLNRVGMSVVNFTGPCQSCTTIIYPALQPLQCE